MQPTHSKTTGCIFYRHVAVRLEIADARRTIEHLLLISLNCVPEPHVSSRNMGVATWAADSNRAECTVYTPPGLREDNFAVADGQAGIWWSLGSHRQESASAGPVLLSLHTTTPLASKTCLCLFITAKGCHGYHMV